MGIMHLGKREKNEAVQRIHDKKIEKIRITSKYLKCEKVKKRKEGKKSLKKAEKTPIKTK